MKALVGKVMWMGRATVFLVGLAVILAAVMGVASMALAANGKPFLLGKNNVATKISKLVKSGVGPALELSVDSGPPLAVNSDGQVANLNADKLDGKDSAEFLGVNGTASDSELLDGRDSDDFLASDGTAADSDRLGGLDSTAFGIATEQAGVPSADCDNTSAFNECAPVEVVVPAGKTYVASVWSSGSWASPSSQGLVYCPAVRSATSQGVPTCITPGGVQQQVTAEAGQVAAASSSGEATLTEGTWILSTRFIPTAALTANGTTNVITEVMVRDAATELPIE